MSLQDLIADEPFSYRSTKSGLVNITWKGKVVTTLSGKDATRFLAKVASGNPEQVQLAMAKATGHFKHGSERAPDQKRGGQ